MTEFKTLAEAVVGEEFEPLEYVVTAEMVGKYAEGVENEALWLDRSPSEGMRVHPAICDNDGLNISRVKYVRPLGTLHAKQEFDFLNPARVGKKVRVRGKVVDRYVRKEREYTVVEALSVDEDGVEILRSRQILCYPLSTKKVGADDGGPIDPLGDGKKP